MRGFNKFFDEFVGLGKRHAGGQGLPGREAKIECFRSAASARRYSGRLLRLTPRISSRQARMAFCKSCGV